MGFALPPAALLLAPLLLMLGSCGSPPKPPTVNESQKRAANSATAVNLQACKNDLHNLNIVASESERSVASMAASLERMAAHQKALVAVQAAQAEASPPPVGNSVFTIRFEFGSSTAVVPADKAAGLIEAARVAPLVLLRGRTDGSIDSLAESRIARERAAAVRDYLVAAGVDPARIRATYQPVGDYAADNSSPKGQGMNRRVEIELYKALPMALN